MIAPDPPNESDRPEELIEAHQDLHRLNTELETLLDVNRAIGRHLKRDELFGALAACLSNIFETDRFGIELPIEGERMQGHLLTPSGAKREPTRVKVLPAQGTACNWVLQNREWLVSSARDELQERFPLTFEVMTKEGMESLCAMALVSDDRARGSSEEICDLLNLSRDNLWVMLHRARLKLRNSLEAEWFRGHDSGSPGLTGIAHHKSRDVASYPAVAA